MAEGLEKLNQRAERSLYTLLDRRVGRLGFGLGCLLWCPAATEPLHNMPLPAKHSFG